MYFNIAVHICTDRKLTEKLFITHKRQFVAGNIQLYYISIIFLPTILIYLNDKETMTMTMTMTMFLFYIIILRKELYNINKLGNVMYKHDYVRRL